MTKLREQYHKEATAPPPDIAKAWAEVQKAMRKVQNCSRFKRQTRWRLRQIESKMWERAWELERKMQSQVIDKIRTKAGISFMEEQGFPLDENFLPPLKFQEPLSPPTETES